MGAFECESMRITSDLPRCVERATRRSDLQLVCVFVCLCSPPAVSFLKIQFQANISLTFPL